MRHRLHGLAAIALLGTLIGVVGCEEGAEYQYEPEATEGLEQEDSALMEPAPEADQGTATNGEAVESSAQPEPVGGEQPAEPQPAEPQPAEPQSAESEGVEEESVEEVNP